MIYDGIEVETSTTGTGNLSTSNVSGYLTINDISTDVVVPYILEAEGGDREYGWGRRTATDTFARSSVTGTQVSDAEDYSSPSALSLPTGTHRLIIGPHTGSAPLAQPFISTRESGSGYVSDARAGQLDNGSLSCTANRLLWVGFRLEYPGEYDAIHIVCASTGASVKAGIYAVGTNGEPVAKLATHDTGTTLSAGGNDLALDEGDIYLPATDYFVGLLLSASSGQLRGHTQPFSPLTALGYDESAEKNVTYMYETRTYALGMPSAPVSTLSIPASTRPQVILRKA